MLADEKTRISSVGLAWDGLASGKWLAGRRDLRISIDSVLKEALYHYDYEL